MGRSGSAIGAIALLALGCPGDDECVPEWRSVVDDSDEDDSDLGAAVLSVWGPAHDDLDFAGGTLGVEPRRGVLLHFDGARWTDLEVGVEPTLWWVTRSPEGTLWAAGEEGLVVQRSGTGFTLHEHVADATLFGVWAAADDDVWTVGGAVGEGERDVIARWDGTAWTRVEAPATYGVQLFKVWGSAADDVFIVGGGGVILHWDGAELTEMESGTRAQLLTVHGRGPDDVWAVGISTAILHYDGTAWRSWEDPSGAEVFIGGPAGVWAAAGGDVCIVAGGGGKMRIRPDLTHVDESFEGSANDLHGSWCDAEGRAFAVGGNYVSTSAEERTGAIDFRGCTRASGDGLP